MKCSSCSRWRRTQRCARARPCACSVPLTGHRRARRWHHALLSSLCCRQLSAAAGLLHAMHTQQAHCLCCLRACLPPAPGLPHPTPPPLQACFKRNQHARTPPPHPCRRASSATSMRAPPPTPAGVLQAQPACAHPPPHPCRRASSATSMRAPRRTSRPWLPSGRRPTAPTNLWRQPSSCTPRVGGGVDPWAGNGSARARGGGLATVVRRGERSRERALREQGRPLLQQFLPDPPPPPLPALFPVRPRSPRPHQGCGHG
jgi:hypothetical protein